MGLYAEICFNCTHALASHNRRRDSADNSCVGDCFCKEFVFAPGCYRCSKKYSNQVVPQVCPIEKGMLCRCECHKGIAQ